MDKDNDSDNNQDNDGNKDTIDDKDKAMDVEVYIPWSCIAPVQFVMLLIGSIRLQGYIDKDKSYWVRDFY